MPWSAIAVRRPPQLSQPFARLLPVRWSRSPESRFRVQLTERGRELHWLPSTDAGPAGEALTRLPTLARNEQPQEPKPLAVVLATATAGAWPAPTAAGFRSSPISRMDRAGSW